MFFKEYSLLSPEQVKEVLGELKDWEEGKARTAELTGTVKRNLEIKNPDLGGNLSKILYSNSEFQMEWLPEKVWVFKFNNYKNGGTYQRHTDAPMMGEVRTDAACTLFLTDDYEGGELCIEVGGEVLTHKGKAGTCVVYPCGQPHWVNPVTKGQRIAGITWIQSFIRDEKDRQILTNLKRAHRRLEDLDRDLAVDVAQVHGDLMRKWMN
jgi:PKHD-type hydroxylase